MKRINLLPPSEQNLIYKEKIFGSVKTFLFWSLFTYLVIAAITFGARYYYQYTASNVDSEIMEEQAFIDKQDNVNLKKEIDAYNAIVSDYNNLAKDIPRWSGVLEKFSSLVPEEIYLSNLSANSKTGRIDISGIGGTREAVLLLRDNILANKEFKNIDYPFENLKKAENVPFHYTFYWANVPIPPPEPTKNTPKGTKK